MSGCFIATARIAFYVHSNQFLAEECNKGYYRDASFRCIPYTCKVGEGCSECVYQSLRTADGQCAECSPGYVKTSDDLCEPFVCLTGWADRFLMVSGCVETSFGLHWVHIMNATRMIPALKNRTNDESIRVHLM